MASPVVNVTLVVVAADLMRWCAPGRRSGPPPIVVGAPNVDILRDHLTLRRRYDGVQLVSSEDWSTFNGANWWITVVAQPSSDAASANRWCDARGIDPFNCFAKMITSRLRIDFRQFVGDVEWRACAESSSG